MNTTYMIPVKIESRDRARNLVASVRFLLKNTDGKIMIKEVSDQQLVPSLLHDEMRNSRVRYIFEISNGAFHRTKYLNDMIELAETPIVSNYDADVLLPKNSYYESEVMILNETFDIVYPYPISDTGLIKLFVDEEREKKFLSSSDLESLSGCTIQTWRAHAGFCFFAKKESYISAGGENENFVSWGPEDGERLNRFEKLGLRIGRLNSQVMHMEHSRGPDSGDTHSRGRANWDLHNHLLTFTTEQLSSYIDSQDYFIKRGWKTK